MKFLKIYKGKGLSKGENVNTETKGGRVSHQDLLMVQQRPSRNIML